MPQWNTQNTEYRIKPEPIEVELWVGKDDHGNDRVYDVPPPGALQDGFSTRRFREVIE